MKVKSPSGLELWAPKNEYRVIGVDTFEGPFADYLIGDFLSKEDALEAVAKHGGEMNLVYCYDDQGTLIDKAGTF